MLSAIVPNRDGRELLAQTLPALLEALKFWGGRWELIVVDDGSSDGSPEFVRENFPGVKVVALCKSQGFIGAVHAGVREARGDLLLLFNNDVLPERDFLPLLVEHFSKPNTFASSPAVGAWLDDGRLIKPDLPFGSPVEALLAPGGAGLFDRAKFEALKGFDPIFKPFYGEDLDLSFRAWRRGWRVVLDPRSVVYHREATTIRRFYDRLYVERCMWRSFILFGWKNYLDWGYLGRSVLGLMRTFADDAMVCGGPIVSVAALSALLRMPQALARRVSERAEATRGDREAVALMRVCRLPWGIEREESAPRGR